MSFNLKFYNLVFIYLVHRWLQAVRKSSIGQTSWKLTLLHTQVQSPTDAKRVIAPSLVGHICANTSDFMRRIFGSGVNAVIMALCGRIFSSIMTVQAWCHQQHGQASMLSDGKLVGRARMCHCMRTRLGLLLMPWRYIYNFVIMCFLIYLGLSFWESIIVATEPYVQCIRLSVYLLYVYFDAVRWQEMYPACKFTATTMPKSSSLVDLV